MFGIKDFYTSILKKLLSDALTFTETIIDLNDHGKRIIYHSCKSLLFNQEQTWMNKRSDLFDISMSAYYSTEVRELIGIFYCICWDGNAIQKALDYIGTMDCQFLRTAMVRKWKALRNVYKKYLKTMVWTQL